MWYEPKFGQGLIRLQAEPVEVFRAHILIDIYWI